MGRKTICQCFCFHWQNFWVICERMQSFSRERKGFGSERKVTLRNVKVLEANARPLCSRKKFWKRTQFLKTQKPCSDCQSKSDFCAYPIRFSKSEWPNTSWNAFRATFICGLESYSNRISGNPFQSDCSDWISRGLCDSCNGNMLKVAAETMLCCCNVPDEQKLATGYNWDMFCDRRRRQDGIKSLIPSYHVSAVALS